MVIGKRGEKTASLKQCFAYAIWISWTNLFKFMVPFVCEEEITDKYTGNPRLVWFQLVRSSV